MTPGHEEQAGCAAVTPTARRPGRPTTPPDLAQSRAETSRMALLGEVLSTVTDTSGTDRSAREYCTCSRRSANARSVKRLPPPVRIAV